MDHFNLHDAPSARQAINGRPSAGRRGASRGFSLIELVIVVVIIGIIAAIAIPRMSRGSAGAADSALAQNLAILRNAVDLYQSEHQGAFPTGTSAQVADQLLKYSDINGDVSATKDTTNGYIYGPYLRAVPPITVGTNKGKNGIAVSTDAATAPTGGANDGWLFNAATGSLAPNATGSDSGGKAYSSY
jgi:prepilin-type N-terminal cleavage/methylation domain-containing protein